MTVPDVRVTSVRRTVTVAGALVAGQALLCVVIGFVTFGDPEDEAPSVQAAVPRLVVPPTVPPSRPAAGEKFAAVSSTTPRPTLTKQRSSPAGSTSSPAGRVPPASAAPEASVTSPPNVGLLPPSSSTPEPEPEPDDTPEPAVVHERCDTEGATSRTATGKAVRCERGRDGDLRWRLV